MQLKYDYNTVNKSEGKMLAKQYLFILLSLDK